MANKFIKKDVMPYSIDCKIQSLMYQLEQVPRNSVAMYTLRLGELLRGSGVELDTKFPLYYPGMPAYDNAKRMIAERRSDAV